MSHVRSKPSHDDRQRLEIVLDDGQFEKLLRVLATNTNTSGLAEIRDQLKSIVQTQEKQMALGQDILNAVEAETTVLDSFIALVQGQIDNNTIPAAVGAAILSNISANKSKLEAAILANTPQAPVP